MPKKNVPMIAKKKTLFACFNAAQTLTVQLDAVAFTLSVKSSSVMMSTLVTIGRFVVVLRFTGGN